MQSLVTSIPVMDGRENRDFISLETGYYYHHKVRCIPTYTRPSHLEYSGARPSNPSPALFLLSAALAPGQSSSLSTPKLIGTVDSASESPNPRKPQKKDIGDRSVKAGILFCVLPRSGHCLLTGHFRPLLISPRYFNTAMAATGHMPGLTDKFAFAAWILPTLLLQIRSSTLFFEAWKRTHRPGELETMLSHG